MDWARGVNSLSAAAVAPRRQEPNIKNNKWRPARAPSPGHRLLVVDDNQDSAKSLAMLLRLLGTRRPGRPQWLPALELAAIHRPDMVFLDIGMPVMDGYEVACRIRQQPELKNTVLAALTGWGQQEDRRRTAEAGFDHHLVKPLEPKLLEGLLAILKSPRE